MPDPSESTISVYAPGSEVLLDGRFSARVINVKIGSGNVITYECVWWDENGRQNDLIEDWEIRPDGEKSRKMRVSCIL